MFFLLAFFFEKRKTVVIQMQSNRAPSDSRAIVFSLCSNDAFSRMQLAMYAATIAKTPTNIDEVPLKERTFDDFAIMSLISLSVFNASLFSMCFLLLKVLCTAKLQMIFRKQNKFEKKSKNIMEIHVLRLLFQQSQNRLHVHR